MAQPNKGPRVQVATRLPVNIAERVAELAVENELKMSEMTADLVAVALGLPKPSETLPWAKSRQRQREELSLGISA